MDVIEDKHELPILTMSQLKIPLCLNPRDADFEIYHVVCFWWYNYNCTSHSFRWRYRWLGAMSGAV